MKALALIIATLLTGCAYYEDRLPVAQPEQVTTVVSRTLHGDKRCPEHSRAAVDAACATYWQVTTGRARLRVVWDVNDVSIMQLAEEPLVLCVDSLPPHIGGRTDGDIVRLAPLACPDEYACALHEIGHYLGLQHLPHGHGVMAARNPSRFFSPGDLAELHRVGLYEPRAKDVTTVTVTVDPNMPNPSLEIPP